METVLRASGLTKKYRGVCAVDHVSLSIRKGDILGFVGANGAGKTTFMRMACGLIRPTEGKLELFGAGTDPELQRMRRRMGALIEHPAVYANMTALQNLDVQRRYLDMNFGRNPKKALTELLELALVGDPEFIILDEPAIGLDPIGVMELRELLLKLNRERRLTVLFSSHNLAEMAHIATRYGFLDRGRLLKEATAEEVRKACGERGIDLETYFVELLLNGRKAEGNDGKLVSE